MKTYEIEIQDSTEAAEMRIYQIEIKNADKVVVKKMHFKVDEDTAYEMFGEWAARYDSSHKLELSYWRTGELLPEGRQSGYKEFM